MNQWLMIEAWSQLKFPISIVVVFLLFANKREIEYGRLLYRLKFGRYNSLIGPSSIVRENRCVNYEM